MVVGVEPVAEAIVELRKGERFLEEGEQLGAEGFEETFDLAASLGGVGG